MPKIPKAVTELLENLEEDSERVTVNPRSHATVSFDSLRLDLDPAGCQKIFQSVETVHQFLDALGSPDDAIIELFQVDVECDVQDELNELFASVTES